MGLELTASKNRKTMQLQKASMHLCTSLRKLYIVTDLILHIFSTLTYEQTHNYL